MFKRTISYLFPNLGYINFLMKLSIAIDIRLWYQTFVQSSLIYDNIIFDEIIKTLN